MWNRKICYRMETKEERGVDYAKQKYYVSICLHIGNDFLGSAVAAGLSGDFVLSGVRLVRRLVYPFYDLRGGGSPDGGGGHDHT